MAFNSSVILSALTQYVDQLTQKDIIHEIVLEGTSKKYINVQPGVKHSQALNIMASQLVVGLENCGLISPTGSVSLNQQLITVCPLTVQEAVCLVDLEKYWTGMLMKPGSYYDSLTPDVFAKSYIADKIEKIQFFLEQIIWVGNTDTNTQYVVDPNLNLCNGFLQLFQYGSASASVFTGTFSAQGALTSTNAIACVDAMQDSQIANIPNISNQNDLCLFMSMANYRTYVRAWRQLSNGAGNFWINSSEDGWEMLHPGTNLKVVGIPGLQGTNLMVLTPGSNLWMGTDLENDYEQFKIYFEDLYNSIFFRSNFKVGVACAYPQYVIFKNA